MKRARSEMDTSSLHHVSAADSPPARPPKISRKVHACTECQNRKIKCDAAPPERPVCTRCSRKNLKCVVNKSLQSLLEEGTEWKSSMEENSECLRSAVSKILSVLELPPLESFASSPRNQILTPEAVADRLQASSTSRHSRTAVMAMTRENSQEPEPGKMDDAIISAPMGTLYEVTKLRNLRSNPRGVPGLPIMEDDFISSGKISLGEAEELFTTFSRSLNHYLWGGIALVHDSLTSVRQSSSLLLTAILTVTALHIPGREQTFDICYAEFTALISDSMFERYHTLDDIRGLCIGAFWLSDVSWKLSGHAVRIATELNLHQSYARTMRGSQEHFEGTRLWYFIYVCDHHFSIAYGRPPVIHEDMTITHHERFLELPGIVQADLRLHSQVAVFIILTRVYNFFGPDVEQMLSEDDLVRLRHFNLDLDNWRVKWQPLLAPNTYVSTYPAKGVILHQNFGKLQVSSLALRGIQQLSAHELSTERRELANTAITCAMAILRTVLDEHDVTNSVVGVPIYLHTMITYSSVFLLKVQQRWSAFRLGTDPVLIRDLVTRTINLLNEARSGERHLTRHIATGLTKMLDRFTAWEVHDQQHPSDIHHQSDSQGAVSHLPVQQYANGAGMNAPYGSFNLYDNSMPLFDDNYFPIGFFDILSNQFDSTNRQ